MDGIGSSSQSPPPSPRLEDDVSPKQSSTSSTIDAIEASRRLRARLAESSDDEDDDRNDGFDSAALYAQMKARLAAAKETGLVPQRADVTGLMTSPAGGLVEVELARDSTTTTRHSTSSSPSSSPLPDPQNSDVESDAPLPITRKRKTVSRRSPSPESAWSSDPDTIAQPVSGERLQALVAKRRQERLAKEEADRLERDRHTGAESSREDDLPEELETAETRALDDKLTQQARPTRKASKKAIEDMNRETQRMARNMQLTHQAKVKTKFSLADFATRFASRAPHVPALDAEPVASSSPAPNHSSDNEQVDTGVTTPPSSPPNEPGTLDLGKSILKQHIPTAEDEDDFPAFEHILKTALPKPAQNVATERPSVGDAQALSIAKMKVSPRKYRIQRVTAAFDSDLDMSEDDLEIVKDRFAVFDQVKPQKATESHALHHLRMFAGFNNQDMTVKEKRSKTSRPSMTAGQLDQQLLKRVAAQVKNERESKVAELRAKGLLVQTADEREKDQLEIENMLEKARQEAEALRKKEKALAKAEGQGDAMQASDDESDEDDEWVQDARGSADEEEENADDEDEEADEEELELSGSEDEVELDEQTEEVQGLADTAAEDDESSTGIDIDDKIATTPTPVSTPAHAPNRRRATKRVIHDEDDEEESQHPVLRSQSTQRLTTSPRDNLAAAFGFSPAPPTLMSPSQMFAGTMEPSQTQMITFGRQPALEAQDSMDIFNEMVPSAASLPMSQLGGVDTQATLPFNSIPAVEETSPASQILLDSPAGGIHSQFSAVPSPSQDVGLIYQHEPVNIQREASQSTVDTILMSIPESPIVPKRGKLQRRSRLAVEDELEGSETDETALTSPKPAASDLTRQAAARKQQADYDKKKSAARNMVDENAEESEDEYAGIGGASDDDSGGEADEADKAMIDEGDVRVDERRLAAFHAEKARVENEAQTTKLYKDLMTGALRRQRGDAFDLDSDEDEQLAERRRRRQREEARKRRLLLGDDKLGKFDGNDKKEAFLRAIEDHDEVDDVDMLDGKDRDADESTIPASQSDSARQDSQDRAGPVALQPVNGNAQKRRADDEPVYDGPFKRPTFTARRINAAFVKPTSLEQVRESLSFLVEEPHAETPTTLELSDSEHEDGETTLGRPDDDADGDDGAGAAIAAGIVERAPFQARRTPAQAAVVDRLLLRQTSSSVSVEASTSTGMAFVARGSIVGMASRVPALLRRATTASSSSSSTSAASFAAGGVPGLQRGASTGSGGLGGQSGAGMRRQGGKKNSINYAAREAERRAVVEGVERRRRDEVKRIADMRRTVGIGAGGFAGGFE